MSGGELERLLEHAARRDRRRRSDLSDAWVLWLVVVVLLSLAAGFGGGMMYAGLVEWTGDGFGWT